MKKGFTLIELLVVVAIIGILASVVLVSLNSARTKGTESAIKSNLKNMISQAELSYDTPGNYSTACAAVAKMITAINSTGGTAACYTYDNSRWGASAKKTDGTKNWSADANGVVLWDTVNTGALITWTVANTSCASAGGRLPSLEEVKALYDAYGATPAGFSTDTYWSSTSVPSNDLNAYTVNMNLGNVGNYSKSDISYVRCVR